MPMTKYETTDTTTTPVRESSALPSDHGPRVNSVSDSAPRDFLASGGEMGKLIQGMDWSKTPLGPVESWPQSLKTTVSLCVASNFPISMVWGPNHVQIYNDGYWPICGAKHPHSMGQDFKECWASAWPVIGEAFERALAGESQFLEDQRIFIDRYGYLEETFFTFSFSPVQDETGSIGGLFHPVTETTSRMLSERRTRTLRDLAARTGNAKTLEEALELASQTLADSELDIPFVLFYAVENEREEARLIAATGVDRGAAAPEPIALASGSSPWPIAEAVRARAIVQVDNLVEVLGATPCGPYPEPPKRALVLPISLPGADRPVAILVAGVSARLPFTEVYRTYYDLVASTLAAAIANARAYEHEAMRAEQLAKLDRAKTTFFSNVSHELRTPLTLILGPVEDALSSSARVLTDDKLELVRRNALRLYKMVGSLLDFSRIEAGRAQASFVPTDLAAFTAELASAFRSAVESAGLQLHVDCRALPESIYIDPDMWEKIVLNLLSNALKYTYRGTIDVAVSWEHERAVLTIADTGIGIPDDELPRVFERFYRARAAQGRSHEGTGIGLALVRELVHLHGGTVTVDSTLGAGTTFTVKVPRGAAHLPTERVERTPRPRSTAAGAAPFVEEARRWSAPDRALPDAVADPAALPRVAPEIAAARILLVDDNADLRDYVRGLLRQLFPHVETASDGLEALAAIRNRAPDLVLSDVMMPRLDGFGLVRAIREDQATRTIPVILLSARAGEESSVEGLETGADDYLVKPFSGRELVARVRAQLELARMRRIDARRQATEEGFRETIAARDEFLSVASHELRTPLTVLELNLERLLTLATEERPKSASGDVAKKLTTALRQTDRLTRLIDAILDVSRIAMGGLELDYEELDLAALCREVIERFEDDARAARCIVHLDAVSAVGEWDRRRIEEALSGLVSNAIKFGPRSRIDVRLETLGDEVRIIVHDAGAGIHARDLERIFDRFQRAVSADHHGGLGIGLYLARQIVEAHAGRLHVSSSPGTGTTFTIDLPRRPARSHDAAQPAPALEGR